jgi:hypothetical protein
MLDKQILRRMNYLIRSGNTLRWLSAFAVLLSSTSLASAQMSEEEALAHLRQRMATRAAQQPASQASTPAGAAPTSRPAVKTFASEAGDNWIAEAKLDHRFPSVDLLRVPVVDAIDFSRDISNANLYVDSKALELGGVDKNTLVTVIEKNISLRNLLGRIFQSANAPSVETHVISGAIVVSTKSDFAERKRRVGPYLRDLSDNTDAAAILDNRLAMVQFSTNLIDAIDSLRENTDARIEVNWGKLQEEGIGKTSSARLSFRKARLAMVLYFLLDSVGGGKLGYVIHITAADQSDNFNHEKVAKFAVITISTIDDLETNGKTPTTQPN